MTPQEKAKELFNKYATYVVMWTGGSEVERQNCKQCALIAVDEIIDAVDWHEFEVPNDVLHFYFEVKKEIEKL